MSQNSVWDVGSNCFCWYTVLFTPEFVLLSLHKTLVNRFFFNVFYKWSWIELDWYFYMWLTYSINPRTEMCPWFSIVTISNSVTTIILGSGSICNPKLSGLSLFTLYPSEDEECVVLPSPSSCGPALPAGGGPGRRSCWRPQRWPAGRSSQASWTSWWSLWPPPLSSRCRTCSLCSRCSWTETWSRCRPAMTSPPSAGPSGIWLGATSSSEKL